MSDQRPLFRSRCDGWSISGNLGALLNEVRKRAKGRDNRIEQNVDIAPFLGDIQSHPVAAQPFVSSNLADRVFDGISKIFECVSDHHSHSKYPRHLHLLLSPTLFARVARFGRVSASRHSRKENLAYPCSYLGTQPQYAFRVWNRNARS
jgi:hypothetical protein